MSSFSGRTVNARHFTDCISSKDGRHHFHIDGKRVKRATWHAELAEAKAKEKMYAEAVCEIQLERL